MTLGKQKKTAKQTNRFDHTAVRAQIILKLTPIHSYINTEYYCLNNISRVLGSLIQVYNLDIIYHKLAPSTTWANHFKKEPQKN